MNHKTSSRLIPKSHRAIIPDLPSADDLYPYLKRIDAKCWYSNFGPMVTDFQNKFAARMARAHGEKTPRPCLGTSSGTSALSVGLRLLGIGPGKNVLMPSVTFPAGPLSVQNMAATPILADIDPKKWVLTPKIALKAAESMKIDAVMPVSLYGIPLPAAAWDNFTRQTGIPVLIDAAAGVETQKYPKKALVAHSLHALKPFGVGEGGLLIMRDEKDFATACEIVNFGMINHKTVMPGENAKMSELHGAVGLAQLKRWEGIKTRRHKIFKKYEKILSDELGKEAILNKELEKSIASSFIITIKKDGAEPLLRNLIAHHVPAHRSYLPPLYKHPYFSTLKKVTAEGRVARGEVLDGANHMDRHVLGLPFYTGLKEDHMRFYIKKLSQLLDE